MIELETHSQFDADDVQYIRYGGRVRITLRNVPEGATLKDERKAILKMIAESFGLSRKPRKAKADE